MQLNGVLSLHLYLILVWLNLSRGNIFTLNLALLTIYSFLNLFVNLIFDMPLNIMFIKRNVLGRFFSARGRLQRILHRIMKRTLCHVFGWFESEWSFTPIAMANHTYSKFMIVLIFLNVFAQIYLQTVIIFIFFALKYSYWQLLVSLLNLIA